MKRLAIITLTLVAGGLLLGMQVHQWRGIGDGVDPTLMRIQQLRVAVLLYAYDQAGRSGAEETLPASAFPPSLEALVRQGYLLREDYRTLTAGLDLTYYPPQAPLQRDTVILRTGPLNGFVAEATLHNRHIRRISQ